MYKRPEITHNDAFDAGGTRFDVVTPFEELRTSYEGKLAILTDPLLMAEHPVLVQRPIVERGDRAVLARPVENVLELL
jgi:arsenate reductase-like glutaredoxin family protein